jgi:hypothetical protein
VTVKVRKVGFTFSGTKKLPNGADSPDPVSGEETVTLTAKPTKLQGGVSNVLVNRGLQK